MANNPDVFEKFSKLLLSEILILQFEDVFEINGIFIVFEPKSIIFSYIIFQESPESIEYEVSKYLSDKL